MQVEFLTLQQADKWNGALAELPRSDVYFTPAYHAAHAAHGDGEPVAFVAREGPDVFFHAVMQKPLRQVGSRVLPEPRCDLESVYGYGGALTSSSDRGFIDRCWAEFDGWAQANRVVCEFVRWHPLFANQTLAPAAMEVRQDRKTVAIRLPSDPAALWESYPSRHRSNIRKARAAQLTCRFESLRTALPTFRAIYESTMTSLGARSYYFFSPAYYDLLAGQLGERAFCVHVEDAGRPIASALLLTHGDQLHYHLGGSLPEFREHRPNNLLFHAAAEWGVAQGKKTFHLGGGRTAALDDTLFRFKATLSDWQLDFFVGRRVHDRAAYEELCSDWTRQNGGAAHPAYFTLYRLPVHPDSPYSIPPAPSTPQ